MLCLRKFVGLEIVYGAFGKLMFGIAFSNSPVPQEWLVFADDYVLPRYLHFGGVCLIPFLFVCLEPRREHTTDLLTKSQTLIVKHVMLPH
jgi:hypothetical protein